LSRILLHSLVFPPDGVSTAYIMADLAIELKRLGHTVTVLTTTPHYNLDQNALAHQPLQKLWAGWLFYSKYEGMPVWHVKLPMKGHRVWKRALDYVRFHFLSFLASLWTIGPQDIVIATSPPLTIGVMSWVLGARWRAPAVYKVAEVYPDLAIRQGVVRGKVMITLMQWLEQIVYAGNAAIVPIAQQFTDVIRQRGVPENKLWTIPDSVDTELYRPLPKQNPFAEKHGLLNDFVVLYGGNIGIVQDWESVLFAAERSLEMPIQFVIVGDGARREWLAEQIKQRNLSNVKLLGYQSKELMPEINASCDIGTIPMTRVGAQDGFPSKVYSNLACAKPVIVSADVDSEMARLIARAGCGRVVPPEDPQAYADAVLKAYHERDALPAEGEHGRKFVENDFSRQSIARKYDTLIRQLTEH
jgi:colanic acid biosynthesis glycosyl transferase WcaI